MKKVIFLCVAACFVMFACDKDDDPVTKHITVALTGHTNTDMPYVNCLPTEFGDIAVAGGGWLTGNVSEIGTLWKEASTYKVVSCDIGPAANQLTEKVEVRMTGKDGDYLAADGTFTITTGPGGPVAMEGGVVIKGGTGKFAHAFGEITIDPSSVIFDMLHKTMTWTGSGEITYP